MRRALCRTAGAVLLAAVAGCGSDSGSDADRAAKPAEPAKQTTSDVAGEVSVLGVWSGDEQKSFNAVLDNFRSSHPNVTVRYKSAGDNLPTVLATAVEGGKPPDIATVAQPGLIKEFHAKGALKPLDFARQEIEANYPADFVKLGTIDSELYSFVFKGANKSTVWFNTSAFEGAGVQPPADFDALLAQAKTLQAYGLPPYSIAGADGWTLTDLFENIYLRQAGPEKYDQLAAHEIPWTDASVKDALTTMAGIVGDPANVAGGAKGALQTDFPTSVSHVLSDKPKAAMVIEGDFVPGVVASKTKVKPGSDYGVFPFPSIAGSKGTVVGGGDSLVLFNDSPAAKALVEYLASPEAAEVWVRRGGFSSPNKNVPPEAYPDEMTRTTATAIASATTFRFDMSDLAPAAFGGTAGQGEWKLLQDFMANPDDVDATARKLEAAAAKAYK